MPLQQRVIEPVNVSRSTLPLPPGDVKPLVKSIAAATGQGLAASAASAANISIDNELECVANGTLANLIRQLSSLSRQAEELLSGVFEDSSKLLDRTITLQKRLDALSKKFESLDQPSDGAVILRDPTTQHETFSSDMTCDQQVLSKEQMPSSIAELYLACDKPPPLNKLDPYRDDGKDGLKFYTDPTYFFELWKKDMMKETLKAQQQLQQSQPSRQQLQTLQKQRSNSNMQQKRLSQNTIQQLPQPSQYNQQYQGSKQRQNIVSTNGSYTSSTTYVSSIDSNQDRYMHTSNASDASRRAIEVDKSTEVMTRYLQQTTLRDDTGPTYQQNSSQLMQRQSQVMQPLHQQTAQQHPPPINVAHQQQPMMNHQNVTSQNQSMNSAQQYQQTPYMANISQNLVNQQSMMATPPPPPALSPLPPPTSPPPPPPPPAPPAPTLAQPPPIIQPPTAAQLQQKQQQLRKTVPAQQEAQRDPRQDLLAAIKQGITLRRVEDSKRRVEAEKQQSMGNDVASILARRVAMQVSDSDDNCDEDDAENDWDDT